MAATPDGDQDASTECSYLVVQPEGADGAPNEDGDNLEQTVIDPTVVDHTLLAQAVAEVLQDADSHEGAVAESAWPDDRFQEFLEDSRESEPRPMRSRPPGPGDPRLDL